MYSNELRGLDSWLERPMLDAIEESDKFIDWAEEMGYDLEDAADAKKAEQAYEDFLADEQDAQAEAAYEAHIDRKIQEREEREWGS